MVENLNEARLQLVSDVKQQWWLIFYLDRVLNIIDNTQILLRQFVEIARIKYEVGEGLQQDVLLAQLELSKLLDQKLICAKINALKSIENLMILEKCHQITSGEVSKTNAKKEIQSLQSGFSQY